MRIATTRDRVKYHLMRTESSMRYMAEGIPMSLYTLAPFGVNKLHNAISYGGERQANAIHQYYRIGQRAYNDALSADCFFGKERDTEPRVVELPRG